MPPVALKVNGTVMTSSSRSTSMAISDSRRASDPEAQPTANSQFASFATSLSRASTSAPRMKCCDSSTRCTASKTSSRMLACCALRSKKGKSKAVVALPDAVAAGTGLLSVVIDRDMSGGLVLLDSNQQQGHQISLGTCVTKGEVAGASNRVSPAGLALTGRKH